MDYRPKKGKTVNNPEIINSIEIEANIKPIILDIIFKPVIPNFLEI